MPSLHPIVGYIGAVVGQLRWHSGPVVGSADGTGGATVELLDDPPGGGFANPPVCGEGGAGSCGSGSATCGTGEGGGGDGGGDGGAWPLV